jgi:hypothetical protein
MTDRWKLAAIEMPPCGRDPASSQTMRGNHSYVTYVGERSDGWLFMFNRIADGWCVRDEGEYTYGCCPVVYLVRWTPCVPPIIRGTA